MTDAGVEGPALRLHASCVSVAGRAALIAGAAGSGKSSLALEVMSRGGRLVADDQVLVRRRGDALIAAAPSPISGLIEARGIGLIRAEPLSEAQTTLYVDLDTSPRDRLPPPARKELLGISIPTIFGRENRHLAAVVVALLRSGEGPVG